MAACHIPQIAALERLCFSEPWSEKSLSEEIENPAAYFIAAVENGAVLGYAGMHTVLGESYVDNIAVLPAHRGRGIGRALTAALVGHARRVHYARGARLECAGGVALRFARLRKGGRAAGFLQGAARGRADFYAVFLMCEIVRRMD